MAKSTQVGRIQPTRDWVPPVEYLNDLGGDVREPIEFTDHHIGLIQKCLIQIIDKYPVANPDPERLILLPWLLREWAQVELVWHLSGIPFSVLAKQRKRLDTVAKKTTALIQALHKLEPLDRWVLVERLGVHEGLTGHKLYRNSKNQRRINDWYNLTTIISAAASRPLEKPDPHRPRNYPGQLVLMDLAAVFEHFTGLTASRRVRRVKKGDEEAGTEYGPFLEFARAVWPVVFKQGDIGLESQLREWADHGSKKSNLMSAIALRCP